MIWETSKCRGKASNVTECQKKRKRLRLVILLGGYARKGCILVDNVSLWLQLCKRICDVWVLLWLTVREETSTVFFLL